MVEIKAQVRFCCIITTAKIILFIKSLLLLEAAAFGKDCCLHATPCVGAVIFLTFHTGRSFLTPFFPWKVSCATVDMVQSKDFTGEEALIMLLYENDGSQNNVYFNNQTLLLSYPPPGIRATRYCYGHTMCEQANVGMLWNAAARVKSVKCIPAVTSWEAGINPGQVTSPPHDTPRGNLLPSFLLPPCLYWCVLG